MRNVKSACATLKAHAQYLKRMRGRVRVLVLFYAHAQYNATLSRYCQHKSAHALQIAKFQPPMWGGESDIGTNMSFDC